jgi:hypothetical protein
LAAAVLRYRDQLEASLMRVAERLGADFSTQDIPPEQNGIE